MKKYNVYYSVESTEIPLTTIEAEDSLDAQRIFLEDCIFERVE